MPPTRCATVAVVPRFAALAVLAVSCVACSGSDPLAENTEAAWDTLTTADQQQVCLLIEASDGDMEQIVALFLASDPEGRDEIWGEPNNRETRQRMADVLTGITDRDC